jgi:hypothetical protein
MKGQCYQRVHGSSSSRSRNGNSSSGSGSRSRSNCDHSSYLFLNFPTQQPQHEDLSPSGLFVVSCQDMLKAAVKSLEARGFAGALLAAEV